MLWTKKQDADGEIREHQQLPTPLPAESTACQQNTRGKKDIPMMASCLQTEHTTPSSPAQGIPHKT